MTKQQFAHQLTEQVKLLQKATLVHNGEVLLVRRADNAVSRPGCWDLPGGNSEWPEEGRAGFGLHREDLAREILEETMTSIEPAELTHDTMTYFDTYFDAEKQMFSIICGWRIVLPATFDRSSIQLSSEHTESAWVSREQLEQYDFGREKGRFIKEIALAVF